MGFQELVHALLHDGACARVGPEKQRQKLVTAEAKSIIRGPDASFEDGANFSQDVVGQQVSFFLVEFLEVVDVHEDCIDSLLLLDGPIQFRLHDFVEITPVVEPGQGIGDANPCLLGEVSILFEEQLAHLI